MAAPMARSLPYFIWQWLGRSDANQLPRHSGRLFAFSAVAPFTAARLHRSSDGHSFDAAFSGPRDTAVYQHFLAPAQHGVPFCAKLGTGEQTANAKSLTFAAFKHNLRPFMCSFFVSFRPTPICVRLKLHSCDWLFSALRNMKLTSVKLPSNAQSVA
jgi:hypothetical protein